MLYIHHRSIKYLTKNNMILWSILYKCFIEEINNNPIDLLEKTIDEKKEIIEEEDLEEIEDKLKNKYRFDWIVFLEISPNVIIDHLSDFESCDIDWNHE